MQNGNQFYESSPVFFINRRIPIIQSRDNHMVIATKWLILFAREQVAEKSFMESMAGFMKDVVPQTYALAGEQRADPVLWTRIERLEPHDRLLPQSSAAGDDLPLLLVLGYANGIQVGGPSSSAKFCIPSWTLFYSLDKLELEIALHLNASLLGFSEFGWVLLGLTGFNLV